MLEKTSKKVRPNFFDYNKMELAQSSGKFLEAFMLSLIDDIESIIDDELSQ